MHKGELTRQRIIVKAAPVFNQRGYAGCSMHDLMEATGLEKGGLYRHFASKEELAVEAFRYSLLQVVQRRLGGLDEVQGAVAKLRHVVRSFVEVPSPVPGGCPLMNTAADADTGCPEIVALAREGVRVWKARLSRILEEGIESGEIRRDTDPRRVANMVISTLEGALMISRLEGTRDAMLDALTTLEAVLEGLRAPAAGDPGPAFIR